MGAILYKIYGSGSGDPMVSGLNLGSRSGSVALIKPIQDSDLGIVFFSGGEVFALSSVGE
jgi:hypothetical protein